MGILLPHPAYGRIPPEPGFLKRKIVRVSEYPSIPITQNRQKGTPRGSPFLSVLSG